MWEGTLVAIPPVDREFGSFRSLHEKIISIMYRVQLIADNLNAGDLSGIDRRNIPAAYAIAEIPRELENLYDDFEEWHDNHEHTPKAKEVQS
ncbi:MAG: hypothetical protein ACR2M4_07950 [Actinomycetota bacterium]